MPRLPLLLGLAALVVACGDGSHTRPGTPPRNALLVTVGGLRADHTSALMYPRQTTGFPIPEEWRAAGRALSIDELAVGGVLFSQAFAPGVDALAALQAVHATGTGEPLAARFAAGGLHTAAFVTRPAGLSLADLEAELRPGFDRWSCEESDRDSVRDLIQFVVDHDFGDGRGTFLWLHLDGPTFPFTPGVAPLPGGGEVDCATLFTDPLYAGRADGSEEFRQSSLVPGAPPLTAADRDRLVALYDGEVAEAGHLLFYALDLLRYLTGTSAAWESTATVLVGTQGVGLFDAPDPDAFGPPHLLVDGTLRVPLLLRHPGSLTGRRVLDEPVELADVPATLCDWYRLPTAPSMRGRSLLSLTDMRAREPFAPRPVLATASGGGQELLSLRDPERRLTLEPTGRLRAWRVDVGKQSASLEETPPPGAFDRVRAAFAAGDQGPR